MKHILFYFILCFTISSCQKEYSVEGNGIITAATGTLLDSANNCKPIIINGDYKKDSTLTAFNNVVVNVNFATTGNYTIYTDTVNGFYFYAKGYAYTTGITPVTLNGFGKSTTTSNTNFIVFFDKDLCFFTVKNYIPVLNNGTNNDYFPTTNFSHWTYDNSLVNDTTIVKVLGTDKTILSNTYRAFLLQIPKFLIQDTLLYRKDGAGSYYRYDTIGSGQKTEFTFLKDFATVGQTWESPTVAGTWLATPTNVKYAFTLLRKNVTRTIGTYTIDSIIIVKSETQYLINGIFETTNTVEFSYAKKVGLVNVQQTGAAINLSSPIKNWAVY